MGGFTNPEGKGVGLGALLVGYYGAEDFVFAGKVGTGFDTRPLLELRARLDALGLPEAPFTRATALPRAHVHWVRPELVVQGGLHGMDGAWQAAPPPPARAGRRARTRRGAGEAMITHPEKLLFPADGISKGELAAYYEAIAPLMLPHLSGRPVTMERFPAGIERKGFLQKNVDRGFPEWLQRVAIAHEQRTVHYPLIDDVRSLSWLANQNCVTPHVWSSRAPALDRPDLCVFDLDPARPAPEELRAAALAVRDLLAELGLESWLKTSGSKGFHIVVPLDGQATFELAWRFAHGVGALLVKRQPALLTQEFLKTERAGRILIDTGRNGPGATFAAPYAVRARAGAPVSAPCTWSELESGAAQPQSFTLRAMARRVEQVADPWAQLHAQGASLAGALQRLEPLLSPEDWAESLAATTRRPKPRKRSSPGSRNRKQT